MNLFGITIVVLDLKLKPATDVYMIQLNTSINRLNVVRLSNVGRIEHSKPMGTLHDPVPVHP